MRNTKTTAPFQGDGTVFRMDDPGVCPGAPAQTGRRPCGTLC
nr:MAG TPA: hypothetical protein [Caudoviricetes sp.]